MKYSSSSVYIRWFVFSLAILVVSIDVISYYQKASHLTSAEPTGLTSSPPAVPSLPPKPTSLPLGKLKLIQTVNAEQIAAAQKAFVGSTQDTQVQQVAIYELEYSITDKLGKQKPILAKVYVPVEGENYPLLVYGSGTTGMADKCAPSRENMSVENIGNYQNNMISEAAAGYVAVFPDYEGFNDAMSTQAYFVSDSEAKVLLGSIKALLDLQPSLPGLQVADLHQVFLAGYSQGGHAALSTAQEWQQLPADVVLKGVIQYAGAADVEALFFDSPWLASYLVDSYAQYYGNQLDPKLVLQERWFQPLSEHNDELCVNQAYRYYPHTPDTIYTPAFLDAIETHTWPANLTYWQKAIQQNIPLTQLPNVPYLSIQGETDPIVTVKTQRQNVKILCQQKKAVTYREFSGVNHFQIRQASFGFSHDWMKNVMTNTSVSQDCL